MTQDEWWNLLDANVSQMETLVARYHPAIDAHGKMHHITAKDAERVRRKIASEIKHESLQSPIKLFKFAKENRLADAMHSLLNEVWFGMPESMESRQEPGFFTLCDLCSEYEPEDQ